MAFFVDIFTSFKTCRIFHIIYHDPFKGVDNLIEKKTNEEGNGVTVVYEGGNGLQQAYQILAKLLINNKLKEEGKKREQQQQVLGQPR